MPEKRPADATAREPAPAAHRRTEEPPVPATTTYTEAPSAPAKAGVGDTGAPASGSADPRPARKEK